MARQLILKIFLGWIFITPLTAFSNQAALYMEQGQLQNSVIEVFVADANISASDNTRLKFISRKFFSDKTKFPIEGIRPFDAVTGQQRTIIIDGNPIPKTGTVLFFEKLSSYDMFTWMPIVQFIPMLTWEGGQAVGEKTIHLGDYARAFWYTLLFLTMLSIVIMVMIRRDDQRFIHLFCDGCSHLSLSRTQVGLWTLAIGSMVIFFGLIKIDVPDIPESLVALMGLSLATGSIVYVKGKPAQKEKAAQGNVDKSKLNIRAGLGDLVREYTDGDKGELSIARAQMVFWTGVTLGLFIFKSVLSGELWVVPWEMVTLMGISQASYLVPKLAPTNTQASSTEVKPQS